MGWHQLLAAGGTIFALTMLVLVVTSHQWILVETSKQTYTSGIWKTCSKMDCVSILASKALFQTLQVLIVLALFCAFFCSSYMLFTYRYLASFRLSRFLFSAVGCFITGFLMAATMTIYTIFIAKRGIDKEAKVTYQLTFYLAWCLGPIFVIAGFLCLMAYYFMPVHRISLADQDSLRSSSLDLKINSTDSCRRDLLRSASILSS